MLLTEDIIGSKEQRASESEVLDMEKEGGYGYIIGCKNCSNKRHVTIAMGVTVDEFITEYEEKCSRCGGCDWEGIEVL